MIHRFLPIEIVPSFVPIGHERDSVRRTPVVTLGIIVACVVVQIVFHFASIPTEREREAIDEAFDRFTAHWMLYPAQAVPEDFDWGFNRLPEDKQRAIDELPVDPRPRDAFAQDDPLQAELQTLWDDLQQTVPDDPRAAWGFRGSAPTLTQAVSHMFVHADWGHLLGNMLFLFTCAVLLEDVWGRIVFLGFYLFAGLAATVPDVIVYADTPVYGIGASGAISGVMGAFAVRFWNVRMRLIAFVWLLPKPVWIASWLIVAFWFAVDLASIGDELAGGGVAHMAHVAGLLFGAGFALAFKKLRVEEDHLAAVVASKSSKVVVSNPDIERSIEDIGRDRGAIAWRRLFEAARREPDNVDVALALWSVSREAGREAEAVEAMTRAIRAELRRGDVDNATDHWREMVECVPDVTLDAASLILIAERLVERGRRAEAAETLHEAFEHSARSAAGATLLRLATLAEELDPGLAAAAARVALQHPQATVRVKEAAKELLGRVERTAARGQVFT